MCVCNRQNACRTHLPDTLISHRLVKIYTTTTDEISTKQITTSLRTIYIIPLPRLVWRATPFARGGRE